MSHIWDPPAETTGTFSFFYAIVIIMPQAFLTILKNNLCAWVYQADSKILLSLYAFFHRSKNKGRMCFTEMALRRASWPKSQLSFIKSETKRQSVIKRLINLATIWHYGKRQLSIKSNIHRKIGSATSCFDDKSPPSKKSTKIGRRLTLFFCHFRWMDDAGKVTLATLRRACAWHMCR